ncbi:MAG: beta-ketoacyl-ACP synthase III [Brumimicrobium sp.]
MWSLVDVIERRMKEVYITRTAKFLPNNPVDNTEMGDFIGLLNNSQRVKNIVLRSNGILKRHYAFDKDGNRTHTNAQLTYEAIKNLLDNSFKMEDIQLLSVGTTSPDQVVPSHAVMVHGLMKGSNHIEVNAAAGNCTAGMNAIKYGFMAIKAGLVENAVVAGSEGIAKWLAQDKFEYELDTASKIEERPVLAFEKEFLRWMLSDGAGAFLLEDKPNPNSRVNFKIEWIDGQSFADSIETCMYAGAEKGDDGELIPWSNYQSSEWAEKSIFAIKQDIKLLDKHIVDKGAKSLKAVLERNNCSAESLDYFLPHISSFYFKDKVMDGIRAEGVNIPNDKMFTNLESVGNIGAGSIYLILDEIAKTHDLKSGQKLLLSVPESGRFNYMYALLTVV